MNPLRRVFTFCGAFYMQRDLFSFAPDWYAPLRAVVSLGSQAAPVVHQGELYAARRQHLG